MELQAIVSKVNRSHSISYRMLKVLFGAGRH